MKGCAIVLQQFSFKYTFEGKLVPQDPNDKPADMLLERIQVARAQVGAIRESPVPKSKSRA